MLRAAAASSNIRFKEHDTQHSQYIPSLCCKRASVACKRYAPGESCAGSGCSGTQAAVLPLCVLARDVLT